MKLVVSCACLVVGLLGALIGSFGTKPQQVQAQAQTARAAHTVLPNDDLDKSHYTVSWIGDELFTNYAVILLTRDDGVTRVLLSIISPEDRTASNRLAQGNTWPLKLGESYQLQLTEVRGSLNPAPEPSVHMPWNQLSLGLELPTAVRGQSSEIILWENGNLLVPIYSSPQVQGLELVLAN